jgi:hypothetical protein
MACVVRVPRIRHGQGRPVVGRGPEAKDLMTTRTSNGATVIGLLAMALAGASVALGGCVASVDDDDVENVAVEEDAAGVNLLKNGGFADRTSDALPIDWNVDTMGDAAQAFVFEGARLPKQVDPAKVGGGAYGLWVDDIDPASNITVWQSVGAVNGNANVDVSYDLKAWSHREQGLVASKTRTQRLNASCLDVNAKLISSAYRYQYLPSPKESWTQLRKTFSCPAGTRLIKIAIKGSNNGWESRAWDTIVLTKNAI